MQIIYVCIQAPAKEERTMIRRLARTWGRVLPAAVVGVILSAPIGCDVEVTVEGTGTHGIARALDKIVNGFEDLFDECDCD